ncbi:hypothetical protein [Candidatus Neoehrlichia procyonis]|uniref:Uncharacterized protein n=1 Tax=Candidatus Neoehrlichia procyonis str. RAC413 TaxID=1359163 RepID=A0A0F3NNI8_9RICK|nr:hypothetical protein [Candidatus Neoehrlichia lotoris]KJV69267.1 hypothetical protein NLO413_0650 [Candidatus Neoehrlichia lotoris str. RAC413]
MFLAYLINDNLVGNYKSAIVYSDKKLSKGKFACISLSTSL